MKKIILLQAILAFALPVFCQYTYNNLTVNWLSQPAEANKYSFQNLRLYPIYSKSSFRNQFRSVGKYEALKNAIASKKVTIKEKGSSGTVNTLQFQNTSNDTVIILSGEIVKGGQQDRIIAEDIILPPKSKKTDVPVYCVEAGRWHYNSPSGQKNFNGYYNTGAASLRKVVDKEKDQSKVWSKVDEINTKNKTTNNTKTYTAMTSSKDYSDKLKSYVDFYKKVFTGNDSIIGFTAVSGDKILGCDMFATNDLFKKNMESLVSSYATDAILNGSAVKVDNTTIKKYMDNLLSSEQKQTQTIKEKGKDFIYQGKKLKVSSYD